MEQFEKVCKGLECCSDEYTDCTGCPYDDGELCNGGVGLKRDTLALFRQQQERIKELEAAQQWISVKDRLPEEKENWITLDYQQVICCCDFGGDPIRIDVRTYGFGKGHFWHGPQIMDGVVTHWQYLPEPPKEVKSE
jgi:hypothetical protein